MHIDHERTIELVKKGDKQAFGALVVQNQQYAFNLAFKLVCDEDDARDVVQEAFLKIWKHITSYKTEMRFTTWMYKIVSNTAIDFLRARKRIEKTDIDALSDMVAQVCYNDPETELNNREMADMITLLAEELSEKQRLVFILRDLEGLESAEVEKIAGLPQHSVKSNLYHARKAIRDKLSKIISFERSTV